MSLLLCLCLFLLPVGYLFKIHLLLLFCITVIPLLMLCSLLQRQCLRVSFSQFLVRNSFSSSLMFGRNRERIWGHPRAVSWLSSVLLSWNVHPLSFLSGKREKCTFKSTRRFYDECYVVKKTILFPKVSYKMSNLYILISKLVVKFQGDCIYMQIYQECFF